MTVDELFAIQKDSNKLKSLQLELAKHEDFNPYKKNIITDMPTSHSGRNFAEWHAEESERIRKEIELYERKIQEDRRIINAYIEKAPYPESDIIRFKVINNLSWNDIGYHLGYTGRHASRIFWKYVSEHI